MDLRKSTAIALGSMLSLLACADRGLVVPEAERASSLGATNSLAVPAVQQSSRKAAYWLSMSDDELEAKVREMGGIVAIGFKEPTATDGVDERGRSLVSDGQLRAAKEHIKRLGATFSSEDEFKLIPAVSAKIPPRIVRDLRRLPFVDYVEVVMPGQRSQTATTQQIPSNVNRVNAPAAWSFSTGTGVKLMYIDSGADWDHPDLNYKVAGVCAGAGSNTVDDIDGHGTLVAGVIGAANNTSYLVGVSHGVDLWSGKDGDNAPFPNATASCVEWARVNNISVINISSSFSQPFTPLTDQIRAAYNENGILVVVAAGNSGGAVTYPATLDEVVAVSSIDFSNNLAVSSSRGPKIELTAPDDVFTTYPFSVGGQFVATAAGTSYAAPAVAAVAALVKARYPSWTNVQIRQRLQQTATDLGSPGRDNWFGFGLVNAFAAVQ